MGPGNRVAPATQSDTDLTDSQSVSESVSEPVSDDAWVPAGPSQRLLLEDPLILNSPQVSIPKKHGPGFKNKNWPQSTLFPCVSFLFLLLLVSLC